MKRLLVGTIALWAFLIFFLALIHVLPLDPTPDRLAILHLHDCEAPCWIGIMPGVTTLDEAKARIVDVYGRQELKNVADITFSNDAMLLSVFDTDGFSMLVYLYHGLSSNNSSKDSKIVDQIEIRNHSKGDKFPRLFDLFSGRGKVQYVCFNEVGGTEIFFKTLEISELTDTIQPSMQADSVLFAQPFFYDCTNFAFAWHGFASFHYYVSVVSGKSQ